MKKIYLLLITTICSFAFIGCHEDDTNIVTLDILSADTEFSASAGSGTIELATTANKISVEADMSWISFTKVSSTTIEFDILENTNAMLRSAQINISAGDIKQSIPISQAGAIFNIESDVVALDPAGKSATEISLYNNNSYVPTVTLDPDCDWLSVENDSKKISLIATFNYLAPRETTITVDGGWHQPLELTITQDVVDILEVEQITVGREVSIGETKISGSDLLAQIEGWSVEIADCNYLTVEKADESSFVVNVIGQNTEGVVREATVNLLDAEGNIFDSVVVKQLAHSVALLLGEWTLNYGNKEHAIVTIAQHADDVSAGVPVEKSTRLQMTGLVGGIAQPALNLAYADNGNDITLTLDCNAVNYGSWSNEDSSVNGNCYLYAVDNEGNTYAGSNAAWTLTLNPATSLNTLTWAPNAALAALSSNISGIAYVGKSAGSEDSIWGCWEAITTLSREKAPTDAVFTISNEAVVLDSFGEERYIPFQNARFEPTLVVGEDSEWLEASLDLENAQLKLAAKLNYTSYRSTTVTLTSGAESITIPVSQESLPVFDTQKVIVDKWARQNAATAKVTEYVKYVSTKDWSVESSNDWIEVEKSADGNSFIVHITSDNTTGKSRHGSVDLLSDKGVVLASMPVRQASWGWDMASLRGRYTLHFGNNQTMDIELRRREADIKGRIPVEQCTALEIRNWKTPIVFPWFSINYVHNATENYTAFTLNNHQSIASWRFVENDVVQTTGICSIAPINASGEVLVQSDVLPLWDFVLDIESETPAFKFKRSAKLEELDPEGKFNGIGFTSIYNSQDGSIKNERRIWGSWLDITHISFSSFPTAEELAVEYNGSNHTNCW